jgi:Caspase domain
MNRSAILIEASKIKNHADLPGAREDVESYKAYLKSDFGGAWEENEIITLSHPSKTDLTRWVKYSSMHDFSFITFSGHGYHAIGKKIDETRLCINDSEEFVVTDLNPGNPRVFIISDACRKVTDVTMEKYAGRFAMTLNEAQKRLKSNRQNCRAIYDYAVSSAEKGAIYLYSCDLDESASDSNSFSRMLVGIGEAWGERNAPGIFPSDQAFSQAAAATTRKNPQQHPKMDAGRRLTHLPFAVFAR